MRMKWECRRIYRQLWPYVEGTLAPQESARIAQHLASCPDCTRQTEAITKTLSLMHAGRTEPLLAPDANWLSLRERLQYAPSPSPRPRLFFPVMAFAMGGAALSVLLLLTWMRHGGTASHTTHPSGTQNPMLAQSPYSPSNQTVVTKEQGQNRSRLPATPGETHMVKNPHRNKPLLVHNPPPNQSLKRKFGVENGEDVRVQNGFAMARGQNGPILKHTPISDYADGNASILSEEAAKALASFDGHALMLRALPQPVGDGNESDQEQMLAFYQELDASNLLAVDTRLNRKVRVSAEGVPVGDLLELLGEKTGFVLNADPIVADDKVIVFGPARSLRDVLNDVAALFDDTWKISAGPKGQCTYQLTRSAEAQAYVNKLIAAQPNRSLAPVGKAEARNNTALGTDLPAAADSTLPRNSSREDASFAYGSTEARDTYLARSNGNPYTSSRVLTKRVLPATTFLKQAAKQTNWTDRLKALSAESGLPVMADYYRSRPVAQEHGSVMDVAAQNSGLDAFCQSAGYLWWTQGKTLLFRKRNWYDQRRYEVPDRWVEETIRSVEGHDDHPTYADVFRLRDLSFPQMMGLCGDIDGVEQYDAVEYAGAAQILGLTQSAITNPQAALPDAGVARTDDAMAVAWQLDGLAPRQQQLLTAFKTALPYELCGPQ
ncbi:MAG TPA: zf-HC2 domain-containing protein, partial [Chthonomonadaceae bacterium]|nr:zf-HC2 domain-containing protein [Chthonomonadaceae bacterium]